LEWRQLGLEWGQLELEWRQLELMMVASRLSAVQFFHHRHSFAFAFLS
jgi:hypothetical protein